MMWQTDRQPQPFIGFSIYLATILSVCLNIYLYVPRLEIFNWMIILTFKLTVWECEKGMVLQNCRLFSRYHCKLLLQIHCKYVLLLCKSRFFRGHVAPLLDNWLLDLSRVSFGSCANFFWDIDTFLLGLQFRHQFCHVFAGSLGLEGAFFFWWILNNRLGFVITIRTTLMPKHLVNFRNLWLKSLLRMVLIM